jgi:hypothetical protein
MLKEGSQDKHKGGGRGVSATGKTFVLWFLLILMFIAIYELVGVRPGDAPRTIPFGWVLGGGFIAVVAGFVIWIRWHNRAVNRFNTESQVALGQLARGELDQAAAGFDALAQKWKRPRSLHVVARHNLAWTLVRKGEHKRAIEVYTSLERAAGDSGAIWQTMPTHLALASALAGDLDAAERWLTEARKRVESQGGDTRTIEGLIAFARAIVECRRGRAAEAARALEAGWREYESHLAGEILRPMRVVRAYAITASEGPRGGSVDFLLLPLRGGPGGELAFLGVAWPEMAAFLASHPI